MHTQCLHLNGVHRNYLMYLLSFAMASQNPDCLIMSQRSLVKSEDENIEVHDKSRSVV